MMSKISHVATRVAIEGRSINVPDVYRSENFNFSGTPAFDQRTGYDMAFGFCQLGQSTDRLIS